MELGFVRELHGTIDQARERWTHIAVGKHGVRKNPGKEARLVLDSTAPCVHNGVTILEKVFNPTISDVAETFRLGDDEVWNGFTLDVKAAHKRVKVHPSELGLLLFRVKGRTFVYQVCHVGGKFSAYWWGRVAALLI